MHEGHHAAYGCERPRLRDVVEVAMELRVAAAAAAVGGVGPPSRSAPPRERRMVLPGGADVVGFLPAFRRIRGVSAEDGFEAVEGSDEAHHHRLYPSDDVEQPG